MAHTKWMKRKYIPQANPYIKLKDQDVQSSQWRPMPLHKMRIGWSKLPHNPFAVKRIAKPDKSSTSTRAQR